MRLSSFQSVDVGAHRAGARASLVAADDALTRVRATSVGSPRKWSGAGGNAVPPGDADVFHMAGLSGQRAGRDADEAKAQTDGVWLEAYAPLHGPRDVQPRRHGRESRPSPDLVLHLYYIDQQKMELCQSIYERFDKTLTIGARQWRRLSRFRQCDAIKPPS